MVAADIYTPGLWHDFFVMVGTGAAALSGLVFVAMTLNIKVITRDPTHRYRAIGTLSGLTAVFMLCALVLMGSQNHLAVGAEMLVLSIIPAAIYINGYVQASKSPKNATTPSLYRTIGGSICYFGEVIGAIVLISGSIAGLYIAAMAIVANFYFMISGAWLLLVGAHEANPDHD